MAGAAESTMAILGVKPGSKIQVRNLKLLETNNLIINSLLLITVFISEPALTIDH
jgi:uncharacterized membrane protein AbrB (regulator of aidB expression)